MTTAAPPQVDIGDQLRRRRLELGLTLEQVARRADCAYSTVIRTENGRGPQVRQRPAVQRIARVLDLDLTSTPPAGDAGADSP